MPAYTPAAIEPKWQRFWVENKTFRTPDPAPGDTKPKYYALDMFPYPSGSGLHVGHPEGYTATDILARYRRMNGFHVLHPMGWDAFGLPAEQHAIATGEHPRINTANNIATFRRQIQALGFSYDWDREVDTTDPAYVKWTQWIFLLLFDTWYDADSKKGRPIAELPIPADVAAKGDAAVRAYQDGFRLAYQAEQPVNWCEALGTVLANEEVIDGKSERGNYPVTRLPLRQWLMRITAYAERLIDDLVPLDWSESIKQMQRNWIGRSEGARVRFPAGPHAIEVFTTRPDTLFGATYMVLSPEHELVATITTPEQKAAVAEYQKKAAAKSDFERTEMAKSKTGVFTGAYAINPVNNERIPVWIADYVLAGYGTGAIMAVPAHDDRDYEFAVQFGLPIVPVVRPADDAPVPANEAFTDDGVAVNSGFLDGLTTEPAKAKMIAWLEEHGHGTKQVNYKLRDWLFSRQRYWGEPFPILHELGPDGKPTGAIEPLDVSELPLLLPEVKEYKPTGSPDGPLAKATDWLTVTKNGKTYRRETNTMPQWAGSCWYYMRYIDPRNETAFADREKLKHWLPVDLYVGGAEHAVLHLLYARFWHKVLFDRGYVHCPEPFFKLVNQGMILGEMEYHCTPATAAKYAAELAATGVTAVPTPDGESCVLTDTNGKVADDRTEKKQGKTYLKGTPVEVVGRADKMSKSRGNVVNPDDVIREYGADSLRLFEMFLGPLEATKPWNMRGVEGVYRFLSAVWRAVIDDRSEAVQLDPAVTDGVPTKEQLRELHKCIKKVTDDTAGMRFNTAISAMMEFKNFLVKQKERPKKLIEPFVLLLAPYAPHAAEELWAALGHAETLAHTPWPNFDASLLVEDEIEVPVSVNGKMKAVIRVPVGLDAASLEAAARADAKVEAALAGKTIKKVIAVPGKMVNVVVG